MFPSGSITTGVSGVVVCAAETTGTMRSGTRFTSAAFSTTISPSNKTTHRTRKLVGFVV